MGAGSKYMLDKRPLDQWGNPIGKGYDEKRWEQIKKVSSVHKLSYKTHVLCKKGEMQIEGTYYEKLINGELV